MVQLSLERTLLVATWMEGVLYGLFVATYSMTLYMTFSSGGLRRDGQSNTLMLISTVMFFLGTLHIALNCYRLVIGFTGAPDGPLLYYTKLNEWSHVMKNIVYATQEMLGSAAAAYRCFILWNRNWKLLVLPVLLILGSIVSGYGTCALFAQSNIGSSVFTSRLTTWIRVFYALAVVENILTTGLMSYRIWSSYRSTSSYNLNSSALISVLRIMVESAALQLIAELILLSFYSAGLNAQFIMLEAITPIVGITFNAITIRLRVRQLTKDSSTGPSGARRGPIQTIGSLAMNRIRVDISQNVENDHEVDPSDSSAKAVDMYDMDPERHAHMK